MKKTNTFWMESENISIVVRVAIASRLLLISLIIIWRSLLVPYDTSSPINLECLSRTNALSSETSILLPRFAAAIDHSIVWDSVYFVRIAQCGYEYEHSYAFMPLLPLCLYLLSRTVFAPLVPFIGQRAVLGLSGYSLNNFMFVLTVVYLYRLSVIVLKDSKAALRASILFCFNPASIFYSSIYTESVYSLLFIGGLYYLLSDARNLATFLFALSGCARSNGVLNAGYICFQTMHQAYEVFYLKKNSYLALQVLGSGALHSLCVFFPFISFQAYGYYNICFGKSSSEMRPWCNRRLPLLYNFIQSHYWGVGFLRYFRLKQLPNFILACPILSFTLCSIVCYAKRHPELFFSIGFQDSTSDKNIDGAFLADHGLNNVDLLDQKMSQMYEEDHKLRRRRQAAKEDGLGGFSLPYDTSLLRRGYFSAGVLPFILHLGFMASTVFFIMHVQVATRFLSASPPLYWFASFIMALPGMGKRWGYVIWVYASSFILLGSLLFSNFYPFT